MFLDVYVILTKVIILFTEQKSMDIILFDENEDIANRLGNILKEKYKDIKIYTNLLKFLEVIFNDDMETILVISRDVFKARDTKISHLLKKFDYRCPVMTYSISSDIYLELDINYIYEYQKDNYAIFAEYVYNIENCFRNFANNKQYFRLCSFQFNEVPLYISKKNSTEINHLYKIINNEIIPDVMPVLTKAQRKLFALLLNNTNGVSISDISYSLWESSDKSKAQNVYSLVHELNQTMSKSATNEWQIIHQKKKYQLVHITETLSNCSAKA